MFSGSFFGSFILFAFLCSPVQRCYYNSSIEQQQELKQNSMFCSDLNCLRGITLVPLSDYKTHEYIDSGMNVYVFCFHLSKIETKEIRKKTKWIQTHTLSFGMQGIGKNRKNRMKWKKLLWAPRIKTRRFAKTRKYRWKYLLLLFFSPIRSCTNNCLKKKRISV